jgi:pantetheine-phosphate adenylyltransferase
VIGVGVNQEKKYCFPLHKRLEHIKSIFEQNPNVMVKSYSSLTTVFAKEVNANYLIRGLRNANDFTYEQSIALINKQMNGIESIFFITDPAFMALSATIVREIFKTGEKIDGFVTNSSILVNE